MKEILITGSHGFIGRAMRTEMSAHGWTISDYDIKHITYQDVSTADFRITLDKLSRKTEELVVLHLAAEVGKVNCEENSQRALAVNVGGTLNVARACADYGVPLVYCSTSEVYGDWGDSIVDEYRPLDHDLLVSSLKDDVSGMYALTKRWGEDVCRNYGPKGYGQLKIIRPTMPYGPGVPPGVGRRALDNLVWQALTGHPMVVHRGAARSWCWIDDLASAIRFVIEADHDADGGPPHVYNVGRDDDEVSMINLASLIRDQCGSRMQIKIVNPPLRQTAVKRISCAKLRGLGWEPKTSLDEGLPKMVEWIKTWLVEQHDLLQPDNRHTYHKPHPGSDSHS